MNIRLCTLTLLITTGYIQSMIGPEEPSEEEAPLLIDASKETILKSQVTRSYPGRLTARAFDIADQAIAAHHVSPAEWKRRNFDTLLASELTNAVEVCVNDQSSLFSIPPDNSLISVALSGNGTLLAYLCYNPVTQKETIVWRKPIFTKAESSLYSFHSDSPEDHLLAPSWTGQEISISFRPLTEGSRPLCLALNTTTGKRRMMRFIEERPAKKSRSYSWQPHIKWHGDETMFVVLRKKILEFAVPEE